MESLFRNESCHYHIGFFLEIPYDADMEKNFDVR